MGAGAGSYTTVAGGNTGVYRTCARGNGECRSKDGIRACCFGSCSEIGISEDNILRGILATRSYGLASGWSGGRIGSSTTWRSVSRLGLERG